MKTVAFNRSRGTMFTTLLVLGGLAALYFYRRNGGKISTLVAGASEKITDLTRTANEVLDKAQGFTSREISTSPEDMDRIAAH